jgi:Cu+-exporting ATPase
MRKSSNSWLATGFALLVLGSVALAAPASPTRITVPDLHCNGCIQSLAAKIQQKVPGVASIQGDMATKTVTVMPQAGKVLSPKQLWETVEKAGKKPTKLEGPSGTFTAKPES